MNTATTPHRTDTTRLLRRTLLGATLMTLALLPTSAVRAESPGPAPTASAAAAYRLPADPAELLRLNDEMRTFFSARVHRDASLERKLDEIVAAILGEKGLHFRYEVDGVYDVREAFRRRSGNCATFSLLVVAIAREFRIPAEFNEVNILPRWNRSGDLVMEHRHINVWVPTHEGGCEIDLKFLADLRATRSSVHVVPDARAFAALYSNAGVFRLAAGDPAGAFTLLRFATEVDPCAPGAWANLACAYLHASNNEMARCCYTRALALAPETMAAISGLAYIERKAGRSAEAAKLERKAAHYRERNPYYLLAVARDELAGGNPEAARRHLARAIRIKSDEPEFYELMVAVARRLGHEREAARWASRLDGLGREVATMAP